MIQKRVPSRSSSQQTARTQLFGPWVGRYDGMCPRVLRERRCEGREPPVTVGYTEATLHPPRMCSTSRPNTTISNTRINSTGPGHSGCVENVASDKTASRLFVERSSEGTDYTRHHSSDVKSTHLSTIGIPFLRRPW